ncbi:hypothetical protein E4T45_11784, partial [Aureobasidium sp. EXF-8846]
MSFVPLNPRPMLQSLFVHPHPPRFSSQSQSSFKPSVSDEVRIRLKWGQEYTGLLVSVDSYMNIQLSNAEEWIDGKSG